MTQRLKYLQAAPRAMELLFQQEAYLNERFDKSDSLNSVMLELIKLYVSKLNGCAFCIDMHTTQAIEKGELVQRLAGVSAWREMPYYTEAEKVALAWAESLTTNKPTGDDQYDETLEQFGEAGLVDLTVAINAINSWNRIAKNFKPDIGAKVS